MDTTRRRTKTVSTEQPAASWAYRLLLLGFVVAPTLAGLDKFFNVLTNWQQYLAPQVAALLPITAGSFMLIVGVIEMLAGLLVALKPRVGGVVVGLWLLGIVGNLLLGGFYDIALRDFGLALGAFSLASLAVAHERSKVVVNVRPSYRDPVVAPHRDVPVV